MNIASNTISSVSEANQNFSKATQTDNRCVSVQTVDDDYVMLISNKLMERNAAVYEELAK